MGSFLAVGIEAVGLAALAVIVGISASRSEKCGTKKKQIGVAAGMVALALIGIIITGIAF